MQRLLGWFLTTLLVVFGLSCSGAVSSICGADADSKSSGAVDKASQRGWSNWRGPQQNGQSVARNLPENLSPDGPNLLWTLDLAGRGTPVGFKDRLFVFGYRGEDADLHEVLLAIDPVSGKVIWEQRFNDFLSDIIYQRYSIGSPTVDPTTGNVYLMTSTGAVHAFDFEGNELWNRSMMEEFGRIAFPNGRTGAPVVVDGMVIVRGITTNAGRNGPARDRLYAFDAATGVLQWISTPGTAPKDSSFSTPFVANINGRKLLYVGTGCGNVVCVDARTGQPLWRFPLSQGGVNSSVVVDGEHLIAIHGKENLDSSQTGRMVAIKPPAIDGGKSQNVLRRTHEVWRNDLGNFTSSPVLVDGVLYQLLPTGFLVAVDAADGRELWRKKLANEQLHASPLWADGKLYVPMLNGDVFVLAVERAGVKEISRVRLKGDCIGSPAAFGGRLYIHTTERLYAFGDKKRRRSRSIDSPAKPAPGAIASHRVVPPSWLLQAGQEQNVVIEALDAQGRLVRAYAADEWALDTTSSQPVEMARPGVVRARAGSGYFADNVAIRLPGHDAALKVYVRVVPAPPFSVDFEETSLQPGPERHFAHPPAPWIGGKMKWEVVSHEGSKVLRKTLKRLLFQRAITFIGHPDLENYTIEADIMSDGSRRLLGTVGVINQRYVIALNGGWQQLEVSSNYDRYRVGTPYRWKAGIWYRIKARVDVAADGSGVIRAKVWPRGTKEPDTWLLEAPHAQAHPKGAPGVFGFSPQAQFPVFVDNVSVMKNEQ